MDELTKDERDHIVRHLYLLLVERMPSCGCGDPDAANRLVWDILRRLARLHEDRRREQAYRLIGSDGAKQIVLAAMTHAGLLEHGGSLGGSWIGPQGYWLLWAVHRIGGIDALPDVMADGGFPHCGPPDWEIRDCTDECWAVPEGWGPPKADLIGSMQSRMQAALDAALPPGPTPFRPSARPAAPAERPGRQRYNPETKTWEAK